MTALGSIMLGTHMVMTGMSHIMTVSHDFMTATQNIRFLLYVLPATW